MLWVACGHSAEEPRGLGWIKREQIDRLGSGDFLICHFGLCDLLALSGPDFPIYESESESLSVVQLFGTPWTIKSMEFSRPEYWSG